jgi:hypothetical protein
MRAVATDPRWNALKREGEKKSLWNTWKPKRAKEEKEERRLKLKETREALMKVRRAPRRPPVTPDFFPPFLIAS